MSALTLGCQATDAVEIEEARASLAVARDAITEYDLGWIKADDDPAVIRTDLYIDAPVDVVWSLVRDPNGYAGFNRALTAHIDDMEVGAPITLFIRIFGDALPATESAEVVEIFDESLHVASWSRDFGSGQLSHRPQVLESEAGGTHFYTALKLPSSLAWLVKPLLGNHIRAAFERFALGLHDEALRRVAAKPAE